MPNVPLQKQSFVVPLYAGLTSEVVDKLVQPNSGNVLELENLVCANTGEMSKRDGSIDLVMPSSPTLPTGGTLPPLFELSTYRSELIWLSTLSSTPIYSWMNQEGAWLQPNQTNTALVSMFRGPITTSLTELVGNVTIGSSLGQNTNNSTMNPDMAWTTGNAYGLVAFEQFNLAQSNALGITEEIIDIETLKPIFSINATGIRPKCLAIGVYLCCFYLNTATGSAQADVFNTASLGSGTPTTVVLTGPTVDSASLIEVTLKNSTTATIAVTASGSTGVVSAIDFVPSTSSVTAYALHTASAGNVLATGCMGWVQDFGTSGKLALATQDATNGITIHWGFGAISGSVSTATAEYAIDSSTNAKRTNAPFLALGGGLFGGLYGAWNIAAYTTSSSSTGEFVVMYEIAVTDDSNVSYVARGSRVGSTLNAGAAYWWGCGLVSKFYQPGDGGTYIVTRFDNTRYLTMLTNGLQNGPQNTLAVCVDGTAQPVPQATIAPQAAGGITQRSSSLTSILPAPTAGAFIGAISSLVDLQFVAGTAVQLLGIQLLQITALGSQDTTTDKPIEAFGSMIVPGGTLMAYDGRNYAEALFFNRPEPITAQLTAGDHGNVITINPNAADTLIGAAVQPLAVTSVDMAMGTSNVNFTHSSLDNIVVSGGFATYTFENLTAANINPQFYYSASTGVPGLNLFSPFTIFNILVGGSLTVLSTGVTGDNVIGQTITAATLTAGKLEITVAQTTQSNGSRILGSSTGANVAAIDPSYFLFFSPGLNPFESDLTYAGGTIQATSIAGTKNQGIYTLDNTHPVGHVTVAGNSFVYFKSATSIAFDAYALSGQIMPSFYFQPSNLSLVNTINVTDATFDNTYIGGIVTLAGTKNNNVSATILAVNSPTQVVLSNPIGGGIFRNEAIGMGAYTISVARPNLAIGSHSYVALYSCLDANGRKWRSPPSLPVLATTTASLMGINLIVRCLNYTGRNCMIELYRTQTGGVDTYNKVASIPNNVNALSISFNDIFTDQQIAEQEELFSDGGILPGTPMPGVQLVTSFQGRLWCVSPESPQSLLYSNPDNASASTPDGLLFDTTNLSLDIIDVHGPITAIQSMDTALVVHKKDAIYFVIGNGPDGTGSGGSYTASLIASGIGCSNPRSCVLQVGSGTQADGVWFQSNSKRSGWFTVLRGGTIENTGSGIRKYSNEKVISALVYPELSQIRWYTVSGRTLTWDWVSKIWSTNTGQPCLSAVVYQDVPTYAPSGLLNGYVLQEQIGDFQEGANGSIVIPYTTKITTPWLSFAQLKGWERIYRVQGIGTTIGPHTLTIQAYGDYNDTNLIGTYTKTFDGTTTNWDWELRPSVQKLDSMKLVITGTDPSGASVGSGAFNITGVTLVVGVKKGIKKMSDAVRMVEQ